MMIFYADFGGFWRIFWMRILDDSLGFVFLMKIIEYVLEEDSRGRFWRRILGYFFVRRILDEDFGGGFWMTILGGGFSTMSLEDDVENCFG